MRRTFPTILAVGLLTAATCSGERTDEDVRAWFVKGKVGYSNDYGVYQESQLRPGEWDHIATVHSMSDDRESCLEIIAGLRAQRPAGSYDCRPLN